MPARPTDTFLAQEASVLWAWWSMKHTLLQGIAGTLYLYFPLYSTSELAMHLLLFS